MISLRDYQRRAVKAVLAEWRDVRSTLVVHATGTGKTTTAGALCRMLADKGHSVLFLAHRGELLDQAERRFSDVFGLAVQREQADKRASRLPGCCDVVCASVQSLGQDRRLHSFAPDTFSVVVVDEAHRSTAATYRKVFEHFGQARLLGLTATPDRADGIALRNIFDSVADIFEIRDAIEAGFLVPIRQKTVHVDDLDLSSVKTVAGDFHQGELEEQLVDEAVLHEVAAPMKNLIGDRPTVLFTASVLQARQMAEVLQGYIGHGRAIAIAGDTEHHARKDILKRYERGDIQVVANCSLLTEGWDSPHTSCIAMARPTKSRIVYAQAVGRGLRPHPASGKADCLVLDFVGNAGRHKLVSGLDVLDGSDIDDDVRAAAKRKADEGMPLHEAIDEATDEVARARRHILVTTRAKYRVQDIDPFEVVGVPNVTGRWAGYPATEAQLEVLRKRKIDVEGIDKGQASALISGIVERSKKGLCSFGQARLLMAKGLNPDVSFEAASEAITAIKANRWQTPDWLFEDPRFAAGEEAA